MRPQCEAGATWLRKKGQASDDSSSTPILPHSRRVATNSALSRQRERTLVVQPCEIAPRTSPPRGRPIALVACLQFLHARLHDSRRRTTAEVETRVAGRTTVQRLYASGSLLRRPSVATLDDDLEAVAVGGMGQTATMLAGGLSVLFQDMDSVSFTVPSGATGSLLSVQIVFPSLPAKGTYTEKSPGLCGSALAARPTSSPALIGTPAFATYEATEAVPSR